MAKLITIFSGLAIFIACLGLLGLAAFSAQQKTKEIGIRKVFGASVFSIIKLLGKDFARPVFVSLIIAIPIAWFIMNRWLQNFAYRTEIGIGIFLAAGLIVAFIALLTISRQTAKAAFVNPVNSIRSDQ